MRILNNCSLESTDFFCHIYLELTYRITQFIFVRCRHRNEILKLQSEIRTLKKETNLHQNEICETSDDIRQGTLQHCTNKKKSCKDLLAQALLSEVSRLRFHFSISISPGKPKVFYHNSCPRGRDLTRSGHWIPSISYCTWTSSWSVKLHYG